MSHKKIKYPQNNHPQDTSEKWTAKDRILYGVSFAFVLIFGTVKE